MSMIEEQYMDAPVEQPPFDDALLADATTVTDLAEDRRLTLQGFDEADELGFLVSPAAATMLSNALSQLGVRDGTRYSRYFGVGGAPMWCAFFVSWCWDQATDRNRRVPWGNPGYTGAVQDWARRVGRLVSQPQRGDIYGYRNNGHLGIVESVSGGRFTTIDGNWSGAVTRQGGRVVGSTYFFVRL